MQGSTRVLLDEGGKRKEIADELTKLAKDAFSSLKTENLVKGKPSKYWQVTEQIFNSNNTQNTEGNPWEGDSIANFDQNLEGWKPVGKAFGTTLRQKLQARMRWPTFMVKDGQVL